MELEEERVIFFHELGLAISQWSFVEGGIYKVISATVDKDDRGAVGYGYFAVENFRSKLAFADALLKIKIKDAALLDRWEGLSKGLATLSSKRNRLAHRRVMLYEGQRAGKRLVLERWPGDVNASKSQRPPKVIRTAKQFVRALESKPAADSWSLQAISMVRREFFQMSMRLDNFYAALLSKPEPNALGPTVNPTLKSIRQEVRTALALKPPRP